MVSATQASETLFIVMGSNMKASDEKKANKAIILIVLLMFLFFILMGMLTNNLDFNWPSNDKWTPPDRIDECQPSDSSRYSHNTDYTMDVLSWSPGGKYLAAGTGIDGFIIYDTESWDKVYQNDRRYLSVSSLSWKSDESLLAVGRFTSGICIFDTSTWKPIKHLDNDYDNVEKVAFSPDDSMLASANFFEGINIWDATNW